MTGGGFRLIPVLRSHGRAVVAAKGGDRANYRPIETPLATGSAPADVLAGLLRFASFETVYIADLDAIAGRGDHHAVIAALAAASRICPSGSTPAFADASKLRAFWRFPAPRRARQREPASHGDGPRAIGAQARSAPMARGPGPRRGEDDRVLLSLDFRGGAFLAPPDLLAPAGTLGRPRVIVMTLARVGSGEGPDFERLEDILAKAAGAPSMRPGACAGRDIAALRRRGVAGALASTALHGARWRRTISPRSADNKKGSTLGSLLRPAEAERLTPPRRRGAWR